MYTPQISREAQEDLKQIWKYSADNWGEKTASQYMKKIAETIEVGLVYNPFLGNSCHDVRLHYRRYVVGSHIIFYKVSAKTIFIVRVLHKNMDYKNALLH